MSIPEIPGNSGEYPIRISPEVSVILDGEERTLTWDNTVVRKFTLGEGAFDHVVVDFDDYSGVFRGDEIREMLIAMDFPLSISPTLKDEDIQIIAAWQMVQLGSELSIEE